jgi:hypothetical protein
MLYHHVMPCIIIWIYQICHHISLVLVADGNSEDSIATSYWLKSSEFEFRQKQVISSSPKSTKPISEPIQPPIQWVPAFLLGGYNRSRREAIHSPPSSAEVKNEWSYTSSPLCLHGLDRVSFRFLTCSVACFKRSFTDLFHSKEQKWFKLRTIRISTRLNV